MSDWHETFDWQRAIQINRTGLMEVFSLFFAMMKFDPAQRDTKLSATTRNAFLRLLRPAESIVRRLIIMASYGLKKPNFKAQPNQTKLLPDFNSFSPSSNTAPRFALFDPLKNLSMAPFPLASEAAVSQHQTKSQPHIRSFDGLNTFDGAQIKLPQNVDHAVDAPQLFRRYAALKNALHNLPKQAKRLLRLQAKRRLDSPANHKRLAPLRRGYAPGAIVKSKTPIQHILSECDQLARYALE